MPAFDFCKRHWPWTGLALPCALIALAAVLVPGKIGQLELQREAGIAAERIGAELRSEPSALIDAFARPSLAPHIGAALDTSGYGRRVLRYELYDKNGRLTFTSGKSGLRLDRDGADAATTPAPVLAPDVSLYRRSGSSVSDFAVLTLPLKLNGRPDGALRVYLDQTEQASVLFRYFGLIAAITLTLLLAGVAAPAALAWLRSREGEEAKAQVRYLENYDLLTGLPNRKAFVERLTRALAAMTRNRSRIAVLCIDVDRFQELNDTVDLAGGDIVLREIGLRIQATLRKGDVLARRASDEFSIALIDVTTLGDVMSFTNRLAEVLKIPLYVADREFVCTTSIGIAIAPADGDTAAEILRHADIALAHAKSEGGQRTRFFEPNMDKALQRRRTVEHELRLAMNREEFEVAYQSQYDLRSGALVGVEALVRWRHPVHGKIAPAHFISVAEETGLIVPLGERVLRRACQEAAAWQEPISIAVNLSPAQFHACDIAKLVAEILEETGLAPERLELEITESLLINDTEEVLEKLARLRELGVKIAMDDFGTGYSSLNYLARFPFDKIKIDRQFVRSMTRDPAMRAIVRTIIALGKSLGVTVTAEGVESQAQAAMLREFGCPQVQGFLYGYPAAEAESDTPKAATSKPRSSAA